MSSSIVTLALLQTAIKWFDGVVLVTGIKKAADSRFWEMLVYVINRRSY
ncbi:MAG: hypothetical protein VX551_05180 [Pseudomonadota bacterium]|nr:hypothetical protein [Alteromonas sp. KUL17]MEC9168760.1 hypothetical protein [Pseudomonadota bacterium]